MFFDSQYYKQYGPRSDCTTRDNMMEERSGSLRLGTEGLLVRDSTKAQVTSSGLNSGVLGHDTLSSA